MSKRITVDMKLAPVAAAMLLAFGSAYAQQSNEVKALISPDTSSVSTGVGANINANQSRRFGEYNGLNKDGAILVDFDIVKRDEETGTWTSIIGRDLGLETRELGIAVQKQGDWRYAVDYTEMVRNDPYVIHTGMAGLGTTTPVINLIALPSMPAAWATANGLQASNNVAGHDESLKLKRTAVGLSGDKWISPGLQLEVNFRNEEKKGARMFGRIGIGSGDTLVNTSATGNGSWAMLLTPEPIDSTIRSIESKLNFSRDKLALTAGYYGSFYINNDTSLTPSVPGVLNRGALGGTTCSNLTQGCSIQQIASSAVALPPDNQAHQLYVSGTYAYSDTTRTNFKLSFTHATQSEDFVGAGLTPSATAPSSLGGVVDTTLAQLGVAMRPMKDLSVNASLRYEDRADHTPTFVYNYGSTGSPLDHGSNWASGSQTRTTAKVDGLYRMADGYSTSFGVNWERKNTPLPTANSAIYRNQVFFRETLNETGVQASLRKAMSETLNGALGIDYKQRRGDDNGWWTTTGVAGNTLIQFDPGSNLATTSAFVTCTTGAACSTLANKVLPDMYMDRDRTKVRGNLDWDASEDLFLQVVAEHGQDDYKRAWPSVLIASGISQVVPTIAGARVVTNDALTLEAAYKVSDSWRMNGYWTHSENRWNVNKANLGDDTKNMTDTYGFSVKGKVSGKLAVGVDVSVAKDVTSFNNVVSTAVAGQAAGNTGGFSASVPGNYLPSITYDTLKLSLFGVYDLDKKSSVKVNLAYQEFKTDDWQWGYNGVPFLYSDNTTVSNPNQAVTFLGVAYVRKF